MYYMDQNLVTRPHPTTGTAGECSLAVSIGGKGRLGEHITVSATGAHIQTMGLGLTCQGSQGDREAGRDMIEPAGEGLTWSHPAGRLCAGELERWWSPNTEEAVGTEKGPKQGWY